MSKRGRSEGTIRERADGRWEGRVLLGVRNCKTQRPSFYAKTRQEAQKKIAEAVRTFEQGTFVPSTAQTVESYLKEWLEKTVKPSVRPATHRSYSHLVTFHITPTLGAVRLQRLSPQQVQGLLNAKLADGLSPRTVQYILAVFRRALGKALKWGIVAKNVASLVDAPRVEHHEIRPLDVKEAKKLLKALKGIDSKPSIRCRSRSVSDKGKSSACDGRTSISRSGNCAFKWLSNVSGGNTDSRNPRRRKGRELLICRSGSWGLCVVADLFSKRNALSLGANGRNTGDWCSQLVVDGHLRDRALPATSRESSKRKVCRHSVSMI